MIARAKFDEDPGSRKNFPLAIKTHANLNV